MRGSPVCRLILAAVLASARGAAGADAAGDADAIAYRFRLVTSPELQVRVQAAFTSDAQGETTFEVSRDWGGVEAGGEDISDVRV